MNRCFIFSLLFVIAISSSIHSQDQWGTNIEFQGMLSTYVPSGLQVDEFCIGTDHVGVSVWSIADPANPQPVTHLPLPGYSWYCLRNENLIYVYTEFEDRYFWDILDVTQPNNPQFQNRIEIPERMRGVFIHEDFIYGEMGEQLRRLSLENPESPRLTDWEIETIGEYITTSEGLYVYQLWDSEEGRTTYNIAGMIENGPEVIGSFEINTRFNNLTFSNQLLLGVTHDDLYIFDLTNINEINLISQTTVLPDEEHTRFTYLNSSQNVVYLSGGQFLAAVDINDPENPVTVDTQPAQHSGSTFPNMIVGNYLYNILTESPGTATCDSTLIRIYNLEDPFTLELESEIGLIRISADEILIDNNLFFLVNNHQYLHVYLYNDFPLLNLQSIINPGIITDGDLRYRNSVLPLMENGLGYIGTYRGADFSIVDFENPAQPDTLITVDNLSAFPEVLQDNLLYCNNREGLVVLDVNDPRAPEVVREIENDMLIGRMAIQDQLMYIRQNTQLYGFRITNDEIEFLSSIEMTYISRTLILKDSLLITTDTDRHDFSQWRLKIFQFDEENGALSLINQIASPYDWPPQFYTPSVLHENGLIAVAGKDRLLLFDIANPRVMHFVGSYMMPAEASQDIIWVEDYIAVAGRYDMTILRPIYGEEGFSIDSDTLDFGIVDPFDVMRLSYTISNAAGAGIAQLTDWGLDLDLEVFRIDTISCWTGWIEELEVSVRFTPQDEGSYWGTVWYASGEDTTRIVLHGITSGWDVGDESSPLPIEFDVSDPFPNPFNGQMEFSYSLPNAQEIQLQILDIHGRIITQLDNGVRTAGVHNKVLDANLIPAGVYFVQLQGTSEVVTKRIALVK